MASPSFAAGIISLLALGPLQPARAQVTFPPQQPATISTTEADGPDSQVRYKAAHDSLMRLVYRVYLDADNRTGFFKASRGTAGGLCRRVKSYSNRLGTTKDYAGVSKPTGGELVKRQIVRRRFGVEVEKVAYIRCPGPQGAHRAASEPPNHSPRVV